MNDSKRRVVMLDPMRWQCQMLIRSILTNGPLHVSWNGAGRNQPVVTRTITGWDFGLTCRLELDLHTIFQDDPTFLYFILSFSSAFHNSHCASLRIKQIRLTILLRRSRSLILAAQDWISLHVDLVISYTFYSQHNVAW